LPLHRSARANSTAAVAEPFLGRPKIARTPTTAPSFVIDGEFDYVPDFESGLHSQNQSSRRLGQAIRADQFSETRRYVFVFESHRVSSFAAFAVNHPICLLFSLNRAVARIRPPSTPDPWAVSPILASYPRILAEMLMPGRVAGFKSHFSDDRYPGALGVYDKMQCYITAPAIPTTDLQPEHRKHYRLAECGNGEFRQDLGRIHLPVVKRKCKRRI
jgi:hypothetical protein